MSNHYKHITLEGVQYIKAVNPFRKMLAEHEWKAFDKANPPIIWYGPAFEGTISEEEIEITEEYRGRKPFESAVLRARPKEVEQPVNTTDRYVCCGSCSSPEYLEKHALDEDWKPENTKGKTCHSLCGYDCQPIDNPNFKEQPVQQEAGQYPIGGYAPGNYNCKCVGCKEWFQGDKRATRCEPCAIKMTQPLPPL